MSHIPLHKSVDNPVTAADVEDAIAACGFDLRIDPSHLGDYEAILAGAHEVYEKISRMEDYYPAVDRAIYPRTEVHRPTADENPSNAWAWKVQVVGRPSEGLLQGKTICLKDNIALADVPCLVGTSFIKDWIPKTDATVAARVLDQGGTITGKAVCENLSYFGASISSGTGRMDNVWAHGYSAGGSSTGCGVLVANGSCDMAIGGDQGGSIRLPAAHNGIVGMKPTHGLVPYTGICLLERTIDTAGPMTETVLENALLLQAIAGADGIDDRQLSGCPGLGNVPDYPAMAKQGIAGLRIGIVAESLDTPLTDKRYADMVVTAAHKFLELGASTVETVSLPGTVLAGDLWMVIARLSAYQNMTGRASGHRALYMNDFTDKFLPITQDQLDQMWPSAVATLLGGAYGWEHGGNTLMGKTMNLARKVRDEVDAALDRYDILITPTMACLPQRIDSYEASMGPLAKMRYAAGVGLNTCPYSVTGHPALSLPVGLLAPEDDPSARLPVGMQLIGKFYQEGRIYAAAHAWEQAVEWQKQT